jgi:hypothetical protein
LKSKCVSATNILNNNCLTLPDEREGTTKYTGKFPVAPNTVFHSQKHNFSFISNHFADHKTIITIIIIILAICSNYR